jgi:adenosylcobinamide kinase/adenosylcobinamide-phosphate guanylyltransferase
MLPCEPGGSRSKNNHFRTARLPARILKIKSEPGGSWSADGALAKPDIQRHNTHMTNALTLILGGARSGKTRYAETLIKALPQPWAYVATAEIWDQEMAERIARHQADRSEQGWLTFEAPVEIWHALEGNSPVLVDCLTLWLTNLMLGEHDIEVALARLEAVLYKRTAPTFLVANEVGLGIVPDNKLARDFRDHAGRLHQRLAARADRVVLMVAGLPLVVKPSA